MFSKTRMLVAFLVFVAVLLPQTVEAQELPSVVEFNHHLFLPTLITEGPDMVQFRVGNGQFTEIHTSPAAQATLSYPESLFLPDMITIIGAITVVQDGYPDWHIAIHIIQDEDGTTQQTRVLMGEVVPYYRVLPDSNGGLALSRGTEDLNLENITEWETISLPNGFILERGAYWLRFTYENEIVVEGNIEVDQKHYGCFGYVLEVGEYPDDLDAVCVIGRYSVE